MEEIKEPEGHGIFEKLRVIESGIEKKVFVKGQLYMSWKLSDQFAQRVAVVGLYRAGIATHDELAKTFGIHTKSIYNYITLFEAEGMTGRVEKKMEHKSKYRKYPSSIDRRRVH